MTNDHNKQITGVNTAPDPNNFLARWGRALIVVGLVLFSVSLAFPVFASLTTTESFPLWVGLLDGGLAIGLAILMIVITTITRGQMSSQAALASFRIYRILAHLLLVLLILFFLFGDRIKWAILLPGLAWRVWLLVYVLPAGLTAWGINTVMRNQDQHVPAVENRT